MRINCKQPLPAWIPPERSVRTIVDIAAGHVMVIDFDPAKGGFGLRS